jgi:hypothetical protein
VVIFGGLCIVVVYAIGYFVIIGNRDRISTSDSIQNYPLMKPAEVKPIVTKNTRVMQSPVVNERSNNINAVKPVTIGWAVTITGCGSDPITEGAAVLKHAVHLTSIHGTKGGKYDYKMYAIYHPQGEKCALTLKDLGYELVQRKTPVAVKDIEGKFLREKIVSIFHDYFVWLSSYFVGDVYDINSSRTFALVSSILFTKEKNGCCGEKELVKLEAYTLTDHPIVVHLDLDVVVFKPMDALFDMMLTDSKNDRDTSNVPIMWPELPQPEKVNAFFTRDCRFFGF